MKYTIQASSPISSSFRCASIIGKFDLDITKNNEFSISADLPTEYDDWQIGLICGPSGSGKSMLARKAFSAEQIVSEFEWKSPSIVDDFPKELSIDDITHALTGIGLSSVPVWLLPYNALSNGQKFRADLARALASSAYVVYDEFTSVVDRDVARAASFAVSKIVRKKKGNKFVAITCHSDVAEWLEADWVFDTLTGELRRGRLQRPSIKLRIYAGSYRNYPMFARNHYLGRSIPKHAMVYIGIVDIAGSHRIAGIDSYMPCASRKGLWQAGQTIVLPDFQGLGIGLKFIENCAEITYRRKRVEIHAITASSHVNAARMRRQKLPGHAWKMIAEGKRNRPDGGKLKNNTINKSRASSRLVMTWKYIPEEKRNHENS